MAAKTKRPHGASAPMVAAFPQSTAERTTGSAESPHERLMYGVLITSAGERPAGETLA